MRASVSARSTRFESRESRVFTLCSQAVHQESTLVQIVVIGGSVSRLGEAYFLVWASTDVVAPFHIAVAIAPGVPLLHNPG